MVSHSLRNSRLVHTPPTMVHLLMSIVGPVTAVLVLRSTAFVYDVTFDGPYIALGIITFLASFIVFKDVSTQYSNRAGNMSAQARDLLIAWLLLVTILLLLGYAIKSSEHFSRRVLLTWFVIVPPTILIGYSVVRNILFLVNASQIFTRSVVIVGISNLSLSLAREMNNDEQLNLSFNGYFDDRSPERLGKDEQKHLLGQLSVLALYIRQNKIDLVYIALPMTNNKRILHLLDDLKDTTCSIYFVPDLFIFDLIQGRMEEVNGIPVVAVCEEPFFGITGLIKRLSDLCIASLIMLFLAPVMLFIAIAIKVLGNGSIIVKNKRYRLDGNAIEVYKFRTHFADSVEEGRHKKLNDNPRFIQLSRFLRRTTLDKLPLFFNVIQGRMSVVGPQFYSNFHRKLFNQYTSGYMLRQNVKPGITGWAQVNGMSGGLRSLEKVRTRVEYDFDYLRHWSIGLDSMIILRTVSTVFRQSHKSAMKLEQSTKEVM